MTRGPACVGLALAVLGAAACTDESGEQRDRFADRARAILDATDSLAVRAESFDQASALAALRPNSRSGFTFRLDESRPDAVSRPSGGRAKPTAGGAIALAPQKSAFRVENGIQIIDYEPGDLLVNTEPIRLAKPSIAEFELRIKTQNTRTLEIGWSSLPAPSVRRRGKAARADDTRVHVDIVPDGDFHTYRINATNALQIGKEPEDIQSLFIQASRDSGDEIELAYLRVVGKDERYARRDFGTSYEELANQMRRVLYTATPLSLRYRVSLPQGAVFLRTGMAILKADDPVDFSIRIHEPSGVRTILQRRVEEPDRWEDGVVDMSAWSGKSVEVELRTSSKDGNVAFWSSPLIHSPPAERFNILFIVQDTLRADRLSAYGHARQTSPRFDAMAARGALFEHTISQASKTRPSAAAMMTGLYPTSVGVWNFHEMLDERFVTLAEVLRSQGFATAAFMGNPNAGPYAGVHQGFEFLVHRFEGRRREPDEPYLIQRAEQIISPAVDAWLIDNRDRNFFLYLHLVDPHGAYDAPPPYDEWARETPPSGVVDRNFKLDPPQIQHPTAEGRRRHYDGEIRYNDEHIAAFLDRLERRGILDHTLVIFTSDHGEFLGLRSPELWEHHPPGYAQVLRVPLAMVLPGVVPEGRRVATPVQLIDLVPTILELAEIDASPLILQGQSLVPLLRESRPEESETSRVLVSDEVIGRPRDDTRPWGSVYFEGLHFLNSRKFFDRSDLARDDIDAVSGIQAYRFQDDPAETTDVLAGDTGRAMAADTSEFLGALIERNGQIWRAMTGDSDDEIRLDPDVQEQLRGLGYLE